MTEVSETYKHKIKCYNCGDEIVLTIPKGRRVSIHLASCVRKKEQPIVCWNCGVGQDD